MKPLFDSMKQLILASKTAVVAGHIDPDGDCLGSMLAMGLILENMGLKVTMYSPDGVPRMYQFIPGIDKVVNNAPKKEHDLLVTVDCSDISRLGAHKILAKKILNIDHHPDNTNFGDVNYVELLSSVAELIYKITKDFGIKISEQMAIALYVAIITDTGNFRYSNTLPSTFATAKDLIEIGANPFEIATQIYDTKSLEGVKILAMTLSDIKHSEDKKVVWSAITKDMIRAAGARSDDIMGVIDYLRTVKEAEVAILFREDKSGMIKVNFRSKGKVNVSKIANALGGGGHVMAAGCALDMPLKEAEEKVLELVLKEI